MAIHMDKDPEQGRRDNNRDRRREEGGGGGGLNLGGLMKFLPIIGIFLFKKPKLTLTILAVVAALYFFTGGDILSLLGGGGDNEVIVSPFSMGGVLDEEEYDKARVYEPLVAGSRNGLPSKVSLREYAPKRLNQGRQGSCVGWSSAYAARTIQEARATGKDPNDVTFSPSFLYNQIALSGCQGAYITEAMKNMQSVGSLPFKNFPYRESSCSASPDRSEKTDAQRFRIKGYNRLSMDHDRYQVNSLAIKQNLAQGAPVVIGMLVGGSFMTAMRGRDVWQPTRSDYSRRGFGGHAMCVTGYDDNKAGGAFEIMNSWGEGWGERGFCWVRYDDFEHFTREAYGLYPMGQANVDPPSSFKVNFGLVNNATNSYIGLRKVTGQNNVFRTTQPLKAGDRFKVEITNNMPCYVYIFNEEADGTSNVLFPYTEKHDPYCGITGTRLFPKDYSMKLDNVGNRDRIAVLITKVEIPYDDVKTILNKTQGDFIQRVNGSLNQLLDKSARFSVENTVSFTGDVSENKAIAMIFEVDK
jgi:hypothetical protein